MSGVVLANGETFGARRAVVAGVTPTQLYGLLVPTTERTEHASRRARRFRYGRARMVVHFALSRQPDWIGEPMLADTATIT